MTMTDPISDMLTRIRNASARKHEKVDVPASRVKVQIVKILKEEGFVKNYKLLKGQGAGTIRVYLKYTPDERQIIGGLRRVSKPGLRTYAGGNKIPRVMGGTGIAILSTSRGIMTDRKCRKEKIGGEVLCYAW